jgi:PAS domain S-box-containing protein
MHPNKHISGRETEKDINDVMLLKRNGWFLSGAWTLILLLSLFWNWQQIEKRVYELAFNSLETSFKKDLVYRRWASDIGGIYVPVSKLSPNPYLSHIPERDVITAAGVSMTLVNPAYMTRLVQELGKQQYGIQNNITSLNPLRPENIPDQWERQALNKFEEGAKKATAVMEIDGSPYMRLMRPFFTEESCLKCHGNQGYNVGDILGGISASIPASSYLSYIKSKQYALFAGHGTIWLVGLFFITLMTLRIISVRMAGEAERKQAEETLIKSERHLRDVLDNMVAMIGVLAPDGTLITANRTSLESANLKIEDVEGKFFEECYWWSWSPEVQKRLREAIGKAATGQVIRYDEVIRVGEGKLRTIDFMLSPIKENGRITFLIPSATDITERKQAEEALQHMNITLEQQVKERTHLAETRAQQLRSLAVELVEAEEKERKKIAGVLHDDLQQILASAKLHVQIGCQDTSCMQLLATVDDLLKQSLDKARLLSQELSPVAIHHSDLNVSLKWLAARMKEQFGLDVHLETTETYTIENESIRVFLYRAVQELLFNVVKHSEADSACIILFVSGGEFVITVSDQGTGFNPEILDASSTDIGIGLLSLRERACAMGGSLQIASIPGVGSRFTLSVPFEVQ